MPLKPQDIMVVLKLCSYQGKRPPMSVHRSGSRAEPLRGPCCSQASVPSRLLHGPEMQDKPNLAALEEFLLHGLKYAFPAEHGQVTRGVPTSYARSSA